MKYTKVSRKINLVTIMEKMIEPKDMLDLFGTSKMILLFAFILLQLSRNLSVNSKI